LKFPKEHYPYQYKIDKKLDSKFAEWAPLFVAKLVEIGFNTKGIVNDCKEVLAASDRYRNGQDYLSEFVKEKVMRIKAGKINKSELMEEFKKWYVVQHGKNIPKGNELYDYMTKKFGKLTSKGWRKCRILYDDDADGDATDADA
jgi:phage/plasmid-associated DNA primase